MVSYVRISALKWADLLAEFAMYVMMNYLTNVWNLKTTHAAGIINIWNGITPALAIGFACFVNGFMGHYYMLLISSIAYTIGLGFFFLSTPPVLGPCSYYKEECIGHTQKVLFFVALPLTTIGMGGHLVSVDPFLDLQTKSENRDGAKKELNKSPWQIAGFFIVVFFAIAGGVALPYIKPWSIRFVVPAISMFVATLLFMSGSRGYKRCKKGQGNPLTIAARVFISATRNFSKPFPDHKQLYNDEEIHSTRSLRCLDKAAIRLSEHGESEKNWWLCSVREIEDTKTSVPMLPMWLTFIAIGIVLSTGNTYFLEQANRMDRKLGTIKVSIPIFLMFSKLLSRIFASIYTLLTMYKKRGPQLGIATSMVFSVLCCMAAAKVETRRLHVIKDHDLITKPDERIPMSIFWLLPQIVLLAAVDGIAKRSIRDFFKHQAPESMNTYFEYLTKGVFGLGSMASVFSVTIVGKVSERNQMRNWFQATLNESRLDCYYWTLCALSAANLVIYVIVSFFYKYKESEGHDEGEGQQMDMNVQDTANCCCGSLLMSLIWDILFN